MAQRIFPIDDWAPAQEAMFAEPTTYSTSHRQPADEQAAMASASASAYVNEHRSRSASMSLSWRNRPKSLALGGDLDVAARFADMTLGQSHGQSSVMGWASGHGHGHGHAYHPSASHARARQDAGTLRGIFRRASVSIKGMVNKRTSLAVPGQHDDDNDASSTSRPGTSHSTWQRIRQATGLRHSRSLYTVDGGSGAMTSAEGSAPIPGIGGPPIIPRNTGAAAKAAAALQNEYLGLTASRPSLHQPAPHNKWLTAASSDDGTNDHESGIGITVANSDCGLDQADEADMMEPTHAEDAISRKDFIALLPVELTIHILGQLDAPTLSTASCVSRAWNQIVRNQHIWRDSFLHNKAGTYATSGPPRPGAGQGIPTVLPSNDWRQIYRVKEALDRSWKSGKARPVYLNGHLDSIYCLQFDESKIITGSRDKTIRIWDMHTFECKLVIGPPEVINDVSLLYDDQGRPVHYATLQDNQRAALSVPATASFPTHHKASILCLQYDDRILVTGSSDSTCIVYNIRSAYRPIRRLVHHNAAVLDLAFDERHIVTCSKDVSICVWDRASGAMLRQLRGHGGPVNAVQMRGNTIVSCSGDFRVKLWNVDTGKNIREFVGHTKGLACSQFSEDGRYIASAGNDKVIRVWDANTGECLREMQAHENLVRSLHIDSVSGRLVSGSYDTDIKVFDMETGRQLLDFPKWHQSWVLSAKSDYRRIVSTGQDPKILIMDFGADVKGVEVLESCPRGQGGYI